MMTWLNESILIVFACFAFTVFFVYLLCFLFATASVKEADEEQTLFTEAQAFQRIDADLAASLGFQWMGVYLVDLKVATVYYGMWQQ